MINFLTVDCSDANIAGLLKFVGSIITLIQYGVPILLIVMGMLDLGKAVIASKDDEIKKAQTTLVKRLISAVAVYFVIAIVKFVLGIIGGDATSGAKACIDALFK